MPPSPASNVASRLFLASALRTQPDWRLVSLVRDGYENAFEEIVRRYSRPLRRYAAAIVPSHRAEDVTQDAFSKALLALRGSDKEIELRPWLYRIVRNTALNDLRDQPRAAVPLPESVDGVETPPEAFERREEVAELLRRLRALPDPQRAAIVMRELEGLSHEEIAAALGMTGGAARQTIYRGRRALRDGVGMLIPLPILHYLLAPAAGGAVAGGGLGGAAAGVVAGSAGGAGAGAALKTGMATFLVAGSVATGLALDQASRDRGRSAGADDPASKTESGTAGGKSFAAAGVSDDLAGADRDGGEGSGGSGRELEPGKTRSRGREDGQPRAGGSEEGPGSDGSGGGSNRGPHESGVSEHGDSGSSGSGSGSSGSGSASSDGDSGSGSDSGGSGTSGGGSGSSGGDSGSGSGSGSGDSGSLVGDVADPV